MLFSVCETYPVVLNLDRITVLIWPNPLFMQKKKKNHEISILNQGRAISTRYSYLYISQAYWLKSREGKCFSKICQRVQVEQDKNPCRLQPMMSSFTCGGMTGPCSRRTQRPCCPHCHGASVGSGSPRRVEWRNVCCWPCRTVTMGEVRVPGPARLSGRAVCLTGPSENL